MRSWRRVSGRIANRFLRDTVQHRLDVGGQPARAPIRIDVDVDAVSVRRVAGQLRCSAASRPRSSSTAGCTRMRQHDASPRECSRRHRELAPAAQRGSDRLRRAPRRTAASSSAAMSLRRRIVQLARERRTLTVARCDHFRGERAHPRAVRREAVEQDVEHRADAQHLVVGDARSLDTRAEVAAPDARRHGLEIANRDAARRARVPR